MINRNLASTLAGCLAMHCASASAQQTQTPQPPVVSGQPAPAQPAPVTPALPVQPVQPLPIPPLHVKPMPGQEVLIQPLADPRPGTQPVPPAAVNIATVPAVNPLVTPVPAPQPPPPVLGGELRSKLKVDEQHFGEKSAAAKREFDLREAEEKKGFEATLADKGFWERRRLTRAFRAEQAKRSRAFNDEQEAKRRTYEWRYP